MIAETKYCLANLTNFQGRDSRPTFWWYVLAIVLVQIVLGIVIAVPMMGGMVTSMIDAAQQGTDPQTAQAMAMGRMLSSMQDWVAYGAGLSVISIALFAAAFVRRLHDSGKPGWIVWIPIATTVISQGLGLLYMGDAMAAMQAAMSSGDVDAMTGVQRDMQLYSSVGYLGYLVVILFGVMDSTPGPNKYGDASA
jgi:uncharacterized membrane protein YhaH (DUF805 family)